MGIVQTFTGLTAGGNYVVMPSVSYGGHLARPKIGIWDRINDEPISWLDAPSLHGWHDGADNASALTDSQAGSWYYGLVGATVRNLTDGSSGTITAVGGTITATLSGGTDNDWDSGDEYRIDPDFSTWVWTEIFTFGLPTVARNGVAADCTAIDVMVINIGDGEIFSQQTELLPNLLDNPSFRTGSGDPWIPDGWDNVGLDAGDTEQELTVVHSGGSSLQFNSGAELGTEYIKPSSGLGSQYFYCAGFFGMGDGSGSVHARRDNTNVVHNDGTNNVTYFSTSDVAWTHKNLVLLHKTEGGAGIRITANAPNPGYVDDVYIISLDDVSLTVTPASEANSTESTGLRVDGYDALGQPFTHGNINGWRIVINTTPRHASTTYDTFNSIIFFMNPYFSSVKLIQLRYGATGLFLYEKENNQSFTNGAFTFAADTTIKFDMEYKASTKNITVKADDVIVFNETLTNALTYYPSTIYFGMEGPAAARQSDGTFDSA